MGVQIIIGDAVEQLCLLPSNSVHCVVTSPPYYGLRDYGVAGQIGMEATPQEYIAALVAVFREVRRVLRQDATAWLNLGDCYNAHPGQRKSTDKAGQKQTTNVGSVAVASRYTTLCKPKDLMMMPARVALALQADGWYLRSEIIWHKPSPMPESVTDRPTSAHEKIFLLAKSDRYFYDAAAIAEPAVYGPHERSHASNFSKIGLVGKHHSGDPTIVCDGTRNRRNVWTVPSQPYPDAHFATYPPALIEPCILAGTSAKGVCADCGAPWVRTVDREPQCLPARRGGPKTNGAGVYNAPDRPGGFYPNAPIQLGWQSSCTCDAAAIPATVLDPFAGAGTTGLVADRLGRDAVLIELNPDYAATARARIESDAGLFADVPNPVQPMIVQPMQEMLL